ncbi:MAG: DNA internalization-related competence protein ComEC/Rec2 [Gemmatimonadaceae bacterium]
MPLILVAVVSYAAGVLLGFGGAVVLAASITGIGLAASLARRSGVVAAGALLVGAGAVIASLHARTAAECASAASARREWDVVLNTAAADGAFVQGDARDGGCRVAIALAVERGAARAGDAVRVTGVATRGPRGLLVRHAVLAGTGRSDALRALRAAASARIDSAFGADAGLAKALLVADTHDLDPALRDRAATAGIIHMLSISGLHVGIIAMALQLLFTAARLPRRAALVATVLTTAFYVAMIGAPPPALRSGVMLGAGALSRLLERPTSPWASLAIGAAVPLADPSTALDLGYQLSVLGIAGLIASGALVRRWLPHDRVRGWRRSLTVALATSVVASVVSAPLVAWSFGRVSLVAPLANLAAGPVIGLAQPALFLALVLSPIPAAARFVADATHPLLTLFDAIAAAAAAVPFAAVTVAPTMAGAALCGVATLALVAAAVSRYPARAMLCGASALVLAACAPAVIPAGSGSMEMHAIDVGQGDAIAIRTPRGHWILVDAGRTWPGGDAGRSAVIPYLQRFGGPVDLFVLSHPHADHAGGAASVIRALHPAAYWDSGYLLGEPAYHASLAAARDARTRWHRVQPGDSAVIDSVHLTILAPDSAFQTRQDNPNEASVIVMARFGDARFLFMGDAESLEESWLVAHDSDALRADVLKVGHHGSRTSSSARLLALVRPRVAIVSVGAGNTYGHPSGSTMRALAAVGAAIFRTDQLGSIVVRTDGHALAVGARDQWWRIDAANGEATAVP